MGSKARYTTALTHLGNSCYILVPSQVVKRFNLGAGSQVEVVLEVLEK